MSVIELLLLALGLSMDAFAVAVCKGLALRQASFGTMCTVGGWFGGFQALMPLAGYFLGALFEKYIRNFDHFVAFTLLALIGINMIREARADSDADASLTPRGMLVLAIATSIDALAAGIPFAFWITGATQLLAAVAAIGCTTFLLSAVGVKIGCLFGARCRTGASITGGCLLILLGTKILLEHMGVI